MKTPLFRKKASVLATASSAVFFLGVTPVNAEDLNAVFQQGRAAFYKGDMETAQRLLSRVSAANPKHQETANMLGFIRANHKAADNTLKHQYAAVVLPKVEVTDVTLMEALDALRALSKNATAGKVSPNVLVKGAELGQRKLSLSLSNVPLSEVLNYMTELVGAKATYDKHAVIVSTRTGTATSATGARR